MEKITDPKAFPSDDLRIPGLKPPVFDFAPLDDGDPREVDEFNLWIRDLRNQHPAVRPDAR
jgi:hypothetical protein